MNEKRLGLVRIPTDVLEELRTWCFKHGARMSFVAGESIRAFLIRNRAKVPTADVDPLAIELQETRRKQGNIERQYDEILAELRELQGRAKKRDAAKDDI